MRLIFSFFRWLGGQIRGLLIDPEFEAKLAWSPRRRAAYARLEARRRREADAAFDRWTREHAAAGAAAAAFKPVIMVDWKPGETLLIQDNPFIEKRWRI